MHISSLSDEELQIIKKAVTNEISRRFQAKKAEKKLACPTCQYYKATLTEEERIFYSKQYVTRSCCCNYCFHPTHPRGKHIPLGTHSTPSWCPFRK